MNNYSLSELTKSIVDARSSRAETFAKYSQKMDSIKTLIELISNYDRKELWNEIVSESHNSERWDEIKRAAIKLKEAIISITRRNGEFTIAKSRADRGYVNIGSIGIMREGKSEFVAQTTNLDKWVLPRKKGEHACTTTSINVINGCSPDGKNEIARVYYYSVKEIVSLFGDYLDEFGLDRNLINESINTRDELENWCTKNQNTLEEKIPSSQSKLKKKFMEYITYVKKYSSRLIEGTEPEYDANAKFFEDYPIEAIKLGLEKGKEYYSSVSYYTTPDSQPGSEVFSSFATSKAEIYTRFDVDGEFVDNIQFLDTPGIGEKKVGVDRILSDAVAMNLDVIVAIRALNDSAKEDQEQAFVNILRNRLEGKDYAKEWVYYLLNIWDGKDYSVAQKCIDDLNYLLTTGLDSSSLALDEEHFRVINLHEGYQMYPDNSTDSNNPIGKYLKQILSNLIPRIEVIDNEFFSSATKKYNAIIEDYTKLCKLIQSLPIPQYDDYDRIKLLIEGLQLALAKENAKNPKIFASIQHSINEFCSLPDGKLVAQVFGAQELNFKSSDDFYAKNAESVHRGYDEGSYNSNLDFQTYSNLKKKLTDVIEKDITSRIDQREADALLSETKTSLARVFIEEGKMGFVSTNPQDWFKKVLEIMNNEGFYPELVAVISPFANHKVEIMQKLAGRVEYVTQKCFHHDNFGDPEEYDFQEYPNAAAAITHSLFAIESYAKGLINDGLISKDIEQLQISFSKIYYEITKFAASPDPHKSSTLRDELYHFYKNHSEEVFKGEKSLQKMGLVTSWNNSVKNSKQ